MTRRHRYPANAADQELSATVARAMISFEMEEELLNLPPEARIPDAMGFNLTRLFEEGGQVKIRETIFNKSGEYEEFLADIWIGVVLTLIVVSCVIFMCSCLVYHKFQEWKTRVLRERRQDAEAGRQDADLPSYTTASGLPSYAEAIEQLMKAETYEKPQQKREQAGWVPRTPPTPKTISVKELFPGIHHCPTKTT